MMIKTTLVIFWAISGSAWTNEVFTDANGCYTTRNWERRCLATPNQITGEVIVSAKARAKEKTLDNYKAMEQAKAKAKESQPATSAGLEQARARAKENATSADLEQARARAKAKATGRDPGAFKRLKTNQGA